MTYNYLTKFKQLKLMIRPAKICLLFIPVLHGCTQDKISDSGYGDSVRHIIAVQTSASGSTSFGLDGKKSLLSYEKYQSDVGDPKNIKTISIANTISQTEISQ